jgi:hypothetical protein
VLIWVVIMMAFTGSNVIFAFLDCPLDDFVFFQIGPVERGRDVGRYACFECVALVEGQSLRDFLELFLAKFAARQLCLFRKLVEVERQV